MNYKQKFDKLNSFKTESEFRGFLLELFSKMGYQGVQETHQQGRPEFGKDIIFYLKNKFDEKDWYALVVKKGNIGGNSTKIENLISQIKHCFLIPFEHINEGNVLINKVKVVTNGKFSSGAIESILRHPELKSSSNVEFIWNEKIIEIIDKYFLDFWHDNNSNFYLKPIQENLFSHLSHELKTPIQILMSRLDIIEHLIDRDMSKKQIKEKLNQSQSFLSILNKIVLNYESLLPFKTYKTEELVDRQKLESIFREVLNTMRVYEQEIIINVSDNYKSFKANTRELTQVFYNLIRNAINYSEDKSKIKIESQQIVYNEEYTTISVSNYGIGLNKDDVNKIFDLYFRETKAKDIYPIGNGIGLYVCKKLIEKMNGNITVSQIHNPTVFTISFKSEKTS